MAVNPEHIALREKDIAALRVVFAQFPEVQKVWPFGYGATGEARRASDVDLAVDAPGMSDVGWAKLRDALEQAPIILMIDTIRLDCLTNERLHQRIGDVGILLYAR